MDSSMSNAYSRGETLCRVTTEMISDRTMGNARTAALCNSAFTMYFNGMQAAGRMGASEYKTKLLEDIKEASAYTWDVWTLRRLLNQIYADKKLLSSYGDNYAVPGSGAVAVPTGVYHFLTRVQDRLTAIQDLPAQFVKYKGQMERAKAEHQYEDVKKHMGELKTAADGFVYISWVGPYAKYVSKILGGVEKGTNIMDNYINYLKNPTLNQDRLIDLASMFLSTCVPIFGEVYAGALQVLPAVQRIFEKHAAEIRAVSQ
jgi:hypothetical protein